MSGMDLKATLLTVGQVADFLGVSVRQVWNLRSQGLLPEPVRLGRSSRWRRVELMAWVDAGCPTRAEWILERSQPEKEAAHAT